MVGRILKSTTSVTPVIDYNEKKIDEGNACLLAARNPETNDLMLIEDTFLSYENNPAISVRTRSKGFHMTFGPGPQDNLTEEQVLELIDGAMRALGYENQPYLVYRHNDIERKHYHVVSVRFDADGKKIPDNNEGRRLNAYLEKMSKKYDFAVGLPDDTPRQKVEATRQRIPKFVPGRNNIKHSLEALMKRGLRYSFHSFYQYQAIMRAMNVRVTARKTHNGTYSIMLKGLDAAGKPATTYFAVKKEMGLDAWKLINARIEESRALDRGKYQDKKALGLKSAWALKNSSSATEYKHILSQLDVFAGVVRSPGKGQIDRVTLVDLVSDTIIDSGWQEELLAGDFRRQETEGRWKEGRRDSRMLTLEPAQKQQVLEAIDREVGRLEETPGQENRQEGEREAGVQLSLFD